MSVVCRIVVTIVLMFFHFGILGAAIGYLAHGLLLRVLSRSKFYRAKKLKKELAKIDGVKIPFQEMKECFLIVWYNAWRDGIVSVADYLSTQMSTIVCSGFLSLADTAMFSLTAQLVTAVGKIARSIHNAYTPVFQRAYITGDQKTARETQAFCIFTYTVVFLAGIIAVLTIGIPILGIFKPESTIDRAVLGGYAIYQFMLSFRNCYAAYMSSTNRVWYWKSYIITSLGIVLVYTVLFMTLTPSVWWVIAVSVIGEGIYNFRK